MSQAISHSYAIDVNDDGTLSIPSELMQELGVDRSERVLVLIEDGRLRVIPGLMTLQEIQGSIPALPNSSDDLDDEIEEAISDALRDKYR
jgi:bifunctional DNA-binding transcriptional regulator/antitoxin component of YhaV-PrlF toxin-antitoxin module